jgi:hypothetical protein
MRDPAELIEFLARPEIDGPVLVEALDGFVDAGHAVKLACDHLREKFEPETVALFAVDELLDYRSRRPPMIFDTDRWTSYDGPRLGIELLHDADETPFLLLSGPEPDTQWDRFVTAAISAIEQLDVRLSVGLHSVGWAAPHTRPITVTTHGRPRELLSSPPPGIGKVQIPGSVGHLLEYRLGDQGRSAIGLAAHTPYYLSHAEYPASAAALLDSLEQVAGLSLELEPLRVQATEMQETIDAQVPDDEQVQAVIRELERRDEPGEFGTALSEQSLPTGEELGAEFERFLAERLRPDDEQ